MKVRVYSKYRDELKTGDLIAFSVDNLKNGINKFYPVLIELATNSKFYHVGIVWRAEGRVFIIEAHPPKIRIYPLSKKAKFYHIAMHIDWAEEMSTFLLDKIGEDYSYTEAILAFLSSPKDDRFWVCSELVKRVYEKIGLGNDFGYTPAANIKKALEVSGSEMINVIRG